MEFRELTREEAHAENLCMAPNPSDDRRRYGTLRERYCGKQKGHVDDTLHVVNGSILYDKHRYNIRVKPVETGLRSD